MGVSTIIAGVISATGLTVLNQLLAGKVSMKPVIAGFIVGTSLLLLAFASVRIAAMLALLLLVTSVMVNSVPVLQKVTKF